MNLNDLKTPCYIINETIYKKSIRDLMNEFQTAWQGKMCFGYSVKTNHLPYMVKIANDCGWMTEVVSPDEYEFAKIIGTKCKNIIYNGPQKRNTVIAAIKNGSIVNLDNLTEVETVCSHINEFALEEAIIGLRVNFDLEKLCPGETTCQGTVGRFGICLENGDFLEALKMLDNKGIKISGIHLHSSSRSRSLKIFKAISQTASRIIHDYQLDNIDYIDIGGGLFGGNYFSGKPSFNEYANTICNELTNNLGNNLCKRLTLIIEPGAAILATAMDYLVSVLNIRDIRTERVVTVDGSVLHINPMMNPHETPCTIINPGTDYTKNQIIGGSTCMELDRFYPRNLNCKIEKNTKLLFHACGAYMSTHNSSFINAAPAIYTLNGNGYQLVREKNIETMIRC